MNTSANLYLSSAEIRLVIKYRADLISKCKKTQQKRKLNHYHKPGLRSLLGSNHLVTSPMLLLIPFRRYTSIYLYQHLKSVSEPFLEDSPFSKPIEVNISKLAMVSKCSRNTMRAGYKELMDFGLIMDMDGLVSNVPKACSVVYDDHIAGYDDLHRRVIFSLHQKSRIMDF